jgi:hypothetical protein
MASRRRHVNESTCKLAILVSEPATMCSSTWCLVHHAIRTWRPASARHASPGRRHPRRAPRRPTADVRHMYVRKSAHGGNETSVCSVRVAASLVRVRSRNAVRRGCRASGREPAWLCGQSTPGRGGRRRTGELRDPGRHVVGRVARARSHDRLGGSGLVLRAWPLQHAAEERRRFGDRGHGAVARPDEEDPRPREPRHQRRQHDLHPPAARNTVFAAPISGDVTSADFRYGFGECRPT